MLDLKGLINELEFKIKVNPIYIFESIQLYLLNFNQIPNWLYKNKTNNGNESCINQINLNLNLNLNLNFPFAVITSSYFILNVFKVSNWLLHLWVALIINNSSSEKIQSNVWIYIPFNFQTQTMFSCSSILIYTEKLP